MRILHFCLSCFYVDGRNYQENELVRRHVSAGHDVLVIASTETHSNEGHVEYCRPGDYLGTDGARVIRLPYTPFLPHWIARKLRYHSGVYQLIQTFSPDSMLFHGTCGAEISTVARYASQHPTVKFYVDSHEDQYNSARNFVSRELLHRRFYGPLLRKALPEIDKVLCVSTEAMNFVEIMYGVPSEKLEFMPLGGRPIPMDEYITRRKSTRRQLDLSSDNILVLQSGKQTRRKKLVEALRSFSSVSPPFARFYVVGTLQDDIRSEAERLIASDPRVHYLGWKSVEELTDLLCAADLYIQPGTQSVTMQHALCCHCAIAIDDVPSHKVYHRENGWLINQDTDLTTIFRQLFNADLPKLGRNSYKIAQQLLDYSNTAERVLR